MFALPRDLLGLLGGNATPKWHNKLLKTAVLIICIFMLTTSRFADAKVSFFSG